MLGLIKIDVTFLISLHCKHVNSNHDSERTQADRVHWTPATGHCEIQKKN